jgi:hypothetical protein
VSEINRIGFSNRQRKNKRQINKKKKSEGGEPKAVRALGSTAKLSLHGWHGDFIIFTLPYCPSLLKN